MPEPSVPALVDAAIHIARLADSSNPGLMFPASVERVRLLARFGGPRGIVDVRRRGGDGDWFSVDVDVKTADGTLCVELRGLRYTAVDSDAIADREPGHAAPGPVDAPAGDRLDWSHLSEAETLAELQVRLQAILARELGTPPAAVRVDQPFPELGLDSMMAMTVLREAKKLTGVDLSATMLWNHPTVAGLAEFVTELLAPQRQSQEAEVPPQPEPAGGLLDELFDSVESVPAHSESGV
jgi:acyl carrier protein